MKKFIVLISFLFSFSSYGVGIVESAGALAIQKELSRQSVQNTQGYVEDARKGAQNYESALKQKDLMLEETSSTKNF